MSQHNGTSDKLLKKRAEAKDQMALISGEETWFYEWPPRDTYQPAIPYDRQPAAWAFFTYS